MLYKFILKIQGRIKMKIPATQYERMIQLFKIKRIAIILRMLLTIVGSIFVVIIFCSTYLMFDKATKAIDRMTNESLKQCEISDKRWGELDVAKESQIFIKVMSDILKYR
jgi:hypothetical protein